ncbi:V-set and transmembrane domain-containing protein 4 isoform X2 [Austrofundulus limnaeus]|uniref:V-set and transmembrane domain-containing protein 4 isoform X2 n=1 Tax=Austrofundulus limnaeus TaxID=52670 RepID=A0A2I4C162_AUSLI|nr:PREDICTED: V-set and transmembrane domain-containing protein 4 isoform X2 [Austrofundulus limnaeus]
MQICSLLLALLTPALFGDSCLAINATITPSPFTVAKVGQNVTLTCIVSQRHRNTALPVVKWIFLPASKTQEEDELLIARINMRKARFYGNYTKSFQWPKFRLTVVKQGKIFELLILDVSEGDWGLYMCRVQEFKKHKDHWKASSNFTAVTELRVHVLPTTKAKENIWSLFEEKYHLVKSPQNSSGETVTNLVSVSSVVPKERRYKKRKNRKYQEQKPPAIPAKAPIGDKTRKHKLLKSQSRKVVLPKIVEENLTYAELDLMKPLPELKASCNGTVYAQILFGEQQL